MAVGFVSGVFSIVDLISKGAESDRLGEVSAIIGAGTFLLALIAALVALQAFAAATGLPDLNAQLRFGTSPLNAPSFVVEVLDNGSVCSLGSGSQTVGRVRIENRGKYSARNPAIIVRLHNIAGRIEEDSDILERDWWVTETSGFAGASGFQWDGGADFLIHGDSTRRLPDLKLGSIFYLGDAPDLNDSSITVELLADGGYRRRVDIPVRLLKR